MRTLILFLLMYIGYYAGAQTSDLDFTPSYNHNIQAKFSGGLAVGDFNEDGFLDVVTMGIVDIVFEPEPWTSIIRTHLHINNGNRTFTATTPFEHLAGGQPIVSDFNNDGHTDIFISGLKDIKVFNPSNYAALLYLGHGDGTFTETVPAFPWGSMYLKGYGRDLDNDGNMDIVFGLGGPDPPNHGYQDDWQIDVRVARGNGDGTFTEVSTTLPDFPRGGGVVTNKIAFADIDGNGYDDVLLGDVGPTRLFLNQGNFIFEEVLNPRRVGPNTVPFPEFLGGSVSFGYINDDGLIDLVIADTGGLYRTYFFLNNGDNTFTLSQWLNYGLQSVYFHDFDNDGLSELFSGWGDLAYGNYGWLFQNDNGSFGYTKAFKLKELQDCHVIAADLDNDGDDDLLYMGYESTFTPAKVGMYWNKLSMMGTADIAVVHSQVYPNPTRDVVNIVSKQAFDRYEIATLAGARVSSGILSSQKISLGHLPSGVYIITLKVRNGSVVHHKVIKQ